MKRYNTFCKNVISIRETKRDSELVKIITRAVAYLITPP